MSGRNACQRWWVISKNVDRKTLLRKTVARKSARRENARGRPTCSSLCLTSTHERKTHAHAHCIIPFVSIKRGDVFRLPFKCENAQKCVVRNSIARKSAVGKGESESSGLWVQTHGGESRPQHPLPPPLYLQKLGEAPPFKFAKVSLKAPAFDQPRKLKK